MAQYDGSIRIGTGIDEKGFKAGSKELEAGARSLAKSVSDSLGEGAKVALQKQTDAFVKLNQQYASQEQKVKDIAAKLHDVQRQKIETAEFKELSKDLDKAKASLDRLYDRRDSYVELGKKVPPKLELDISDAERKIRLLEGDIKELQLTNKAYIPADTTKVQQELAAAKQKQMQMYTALQTAADSISQKTSERIAKEETVREKIAAEAAEEERLDQIRVNAVATNDQIISKVERIKQLEQEIADLEAAETTLGYADYEDAIKELADLKQEIRAYRDEIINFQEPVEKSSEAWKKYQSTLEQVRNAQTGLVSPIDATKAALTYMVNVIKEKLLGLASIIKNGVTHPFQTLKIIGSGTLNIIKSGILGVGKVGKKVFSSIGKVGKKAFSGIAGMAKKAFSAITGGAKQSNNSFSGGLKTILRYGLGIRSLYALFNKIRSGIQEGFTNLMGYSDEFANSIQSVKNSMSTLGNQIAAAFSPIVQMVIPWLNSLISTLSTAMTYVAQFIAVLGGKSTFTKATQIQDKYNKSLGGTAKAADKARGALAKFDDLDVLQKQEDASGGGTEQTLPEDMFEEVPIDEIFKMDPYELAKDLGNKLADMLESIDWESIKDKAEKLGRKIAQFLNGIWENERLARDLGMTIGEALNTAVRFAYGFIDENNWTQMGRFLGILVQSGLDTFDEELAGKTAGMLVNGLCDAVIGFFQTYNAGSLGKEIANLINRAAREIDADKLGTAASLIVGGILKELSTFFDIIDAGEIGSKLSQAFIKFLTYTEKDGSVGKKAGEVIASIINSGIDFLLGLDMPGMEEALGVFLTDMLIEAVKNIDWARVAQMLIEGMTSLVDLPANLGKGIGGRISEMLGFDSDAIEEAKNSIPTLGGALEDLGNKIETFAAKSYAASGQMFDMEGLQELQENLELADSDIDSIIQSMIDADAQLDLSSIGLQGYSGSWEEFKSKADETCNIIDKFKDKNLSMTESVSRNYEKISESSQASSEQTSQFLDGIGEKTDSLSEKMSSFSERASTTMDSVSEKTNIAGSSFAQLDADAGASLENTSSKLDSWFTNSIEPYFSAEQWSIFAQNISTAMAGCLDLFMEDWSVRFGEWQEENTELYFGYDIWYEQWQNILTAYNDVNSEFMSQWQNNMNIWWTTMVMPYFTVLQWKTFGENMKNGIMQGFKAIANNIAGVLNQIIQLFNAAYKELQDAMNELIDDYNSKASQLGTSKLSHVKYNPMDGVKVPQLATGAVIRGGNPFMAILGDQPAGQMNVEAPADLIKEMARQGIREELSSMNLGGNFGRSTSQVISLNVNGEEFARLTLNDILNEMNRQGYDVNLIGWNSG